MKDDLQSLAARLEHLSATFHHVGVRSCDDCGFNPTSRAGQCGAVPSAETGEIHGDRFAVGTSVESVVGFGVAKPKPAQTVGVAFVEAVMRSRQRRSSFLEGDLLFGPAWAMLLDIYCATLRGKRLAVSAVLIGSGAPDTTALRYLKVLQERGHVVRVADETDKRRSFVKIATPTFEAMTAYFAAAEADTIAILPPKMALS